MLRIGLAASLILVTAFAQAEDFGMTTFPDSTPQLDQVIYKGVGGNFLETLPLDAVERVQLQRANAVVSSPMTGRTIAVLLGVSGPGFIVGGLIWGIWSALHIESPKPDTRWLGAHRHRVGFCSGSSSKACRLHIPQEMPERGEPTT
jgi:hypothetical protein